MRERQERTGTVSRNPSQSLRLLIGASALAGIALTIVGLLQADADNALMLAALVVAVGAAEFFAVELFVDSHVSVSGAAVMAAGAIFGLPGVVFCAPVFALAGHARTRPEPFKTVFNYGAFTIAGAVYVLVFRQLGGHVATTDYQALIVPALGGALANMAVSSALVTAAISLDSQKSFGSVWRVDFLWLVPQYAVMGAVAIGVMLALVHFGTWSLAVFALPLGSLSEALHTRAEAMNMRRRALETIQSVQTHRRTA
jgi:hypothetical protein